LTVDVNKFADMTEDSRKYSRTSGGTEKPAAAAGSECTDVTSEPTAC